VPTFTTLDAVAESDLLARVRSGSTSTQRDGFEELFRTFRQPVLSLALHLTGNAGDAEDVVQEVFVSVHKALPSFRGEARLSTWIYRITIRAALAMKARRRETTPLDDVRPSANASSDLDARERARRLEQAMQKLSAEKRTVLSLFALEGLLHKEIADILGIPEGTVWSRLSAARKELIAELAR
jgi:RNA polymerase sigma-70 factor (ECF subfamily)